MTEYIDKTGATVTVDRADSTEAFEVRDASGEVAGHEAAQRVTDESTVFGESSVGIVGLVRCEESVDHHRKHRHV